ncbi:unnamed protein product, partial [Rotaria sp. Silwood2]
FGYLYTCSKDDITFTHPFTIQALKSGSISGFVCHFDVNFAKNLIEKVKHYVKEIITS